MALKFQNRFHGFENHGIVSNFTSCAISVCSYSGYGFFTLWNIIDDLFIEEIISLNYHVQIAS